MPFPVAAAIGLGSTLLKAFGGRKKQKAADKLEREKAEKGLAAAKATHSSNEKGRIAALRSMVNTAGARGIKGIDMTTLDPSLFEERAFTGAELPTSSGRSGLGDFLSGAGDIGLGAADFMQQRQNQDKQQAEIDQLMCMLNPAICGEKAGPPAAQVQVGQGLGG